MPRSTKTYELVIASPSDVVKERKILVEIIEDWNSSHSRSSAAVLLPRRWELDALPNAEGHPQDWINREIIDNADILIAVFQARIGSPTKSSISATVEEIERFIASGKPVLIYFSTAPVPRNHDADQLKELDRFKKSLRDRALYNEFESDDDLRRKVNRAIARAMNDFSNGTRTPSSQPSREAKVLSEDAIELLLEASRDPRAIILCTRTFSGDSIQTNGREFVVDRSVRLAAKWRAAVEELVKNRFAKESDEDGEVFELTHDGFIFAEDREKQLPLKVEIVPQGSGADHSLAVRTNKNARLLRLEFMTSQDVAISEQSVDEEGDHFLIKLDQPVLTKLFNTPRPESNHYDLSGPMKFALVLAVSGKEHTITVPAQLQNNISGNTAYREISRSPFRVTIN